MNSSVISSCVGEPGFGNLAAKLLEAYLLMI